MARKKHSGITEQRKAGLHRLEDAKVLLDGKRWRGAMYMAGYAVECALKYKLMRQWNCRTLDSLERKLREKGFRERMFIHSLDPLLRLSGGQDRLRANRRWTLQELSICGSRLGAMTPIPQMRKRPPTSSNPLSIS
jgi:hypothetical protein